MEFSRSKRLIVKLCSEMDLLHPFFVYLCTSTPCLEKGNSLYNQGAASPDDVLLCPRFSPSSHAVSTSGQARPEDCYLSCLGEWQSCAYVLASQDKPQSYF